VYRVVEAVVQLYTAGKFAELADLHNQLVKYTIRKRGNKVPFFIPSFLVRVMKRIPLNTVWLQTHWEGSNYIDVETNSTLVVALQTTSHIFGCPFNADSITPLIMQRPVAFSDDMKAKEEYKPFIEKWTARAGSMRALPFTAGGTEKVPCPRPADSSPLRLGFTFYGSLPQLTTKLDLVTPYDPQSDVVVIGQQYQRMGNEVAGAMTPKALQTSQLDPIPMPFMESNMTAVAKMVGGFAYLGYTVELITRDAKQVSLTGRTINKTARLMFFNHVPPSMDGKFPQWDEISKVVCAKASCGKEVYVDKFMLLVNGVAFATLDISFGSRCPKKGCFVCVECAKSACTSESLTCPVCNVVVPLQERRHTAKIAEEIVQSMISLMGEDNGAAPVGKGVGGSAGSGNKRDRAPEKEIEMEEDDLDGDMEFIHDIQSEIVHGFVFVYPDALTAPLTFSLWELEVPFYEALQKLYKARNTKGVAKLSDMSSLSVGVRRGWVRLMPLHLMIGKKYLDKILELSPTGLWLLLDTNSEETKWGVCVIKFYFGSEEACMGSKANFDGKNAHLITCNPSGKMTHPFTIRDPHGNPVRNLEGKIRRETIQVPFFSLSKGPMCLLPLNSNACLHVASISKTMYKAPAPPTDVRTHESHPHASLLLSLTPNNPESPPLLCPTRQQHQEGINPLQQAIACVVEHGNQHLRHLF